MKDYEWIDVNFYTKQAVSKTKCYSAAVDYACKQCKVWDWNADVFSWILYGIRMMYERQGGLTIGKTYDKENVTKEITCPDE